MSKVIFINRFFYPDHSATSQLLSDLCFALADKGLEILVISGCQPYDDSFQRPVVEKLDSIKGVSIHRCQTTHFGRKNLLGRVLDYLTFYLAATLNLIRSIKRGDIVVAMTDPPLLGVFVAPVVFLRRAVLVHWLQDLFPEVAESLQVNGIRGPFFSALRYLRNISCRAAKFNVAVGGRMSRYLRNNNGVNQKNLIVIPNWAPTDLQPVSKGNNALRKQWLDGDYFVVGYSGNLGRAHDWQTIFQCMEALRSSDRIRFLMIGGGIGMDKLRKAVVAEGLTNVFFESYQPLARLAESLSVSDIHMVSLQPGVSDYLVPSKVYGIAAVGRPIVYIGGEESEIGDMLRRYNCGVMVRPGESSMLCEKIRYLSENTEEMRLMGERGRQMYDENYSASNAHAAWQHLLADII